MIRKNVDVADSKGEKILFSVQVDAAETFFERARGLILREPPRRGCGMLIPKSNAVHTFFMGYPIDVHFLDRHGRLVKSVRNVRPWRFFVWGGWRATQVIETASEKI